MTKEKIVFVFPSYPDVMYSFLLCYAKKSKANISIIYLKELLKEYRFLWTIRKSFVIREPF